MTRLDVIFRLHHLPEDGGFAVPILEPPSELLVDGFMSRLAVVFSDPVELPTLVFPFWAAVLPEGAFCVVLIGFLILALELFRFLRSASVSAMQAPGWGGNGGKSLTGAGGGSWEESCPSIWE